ncbi:uncharacterized protein LOC131242372 isoform X1 [Magnolia sinica]|uniref:uncharacterized protein LOC131242372 isoform X1 n=1 Tax=Magnolia sinica TaxID=86752 RepID=UPI002658F601|nr:uncharacterized protein LOC131242372 isoform X1 [Magnolia sinica]
MSMIRSLASHNLHKLRHILRYGSNDYVPISCRLSEMSLTGHADSFSTNQRPQSSDSEQGTSSKRSQKKENRFQPPASLRQKPVFRTWTRWAFGSILFLILPFWKREWVKFLAIEDEVEKVAEVVETAAEVVEEVASVAETVLSEVANRLPDDSKLKDAVLMVERVSKTTAKDAQLTIDFIHKVDELKQEVEALAEPVIDRHKHVANEIRKKG